MSQLVNLRLIGKPGCHLCDDARLVVNTVIAEFKAAHTGVNASVQVQFDEENILENEALFKKYSEEIPVLLVNDQNEVNGYPMPITNQISTAGTYANRVIFGAWGQALFCDWAGMDVVVDPYTRAAYNEVVVTMNMFADFIVRHWASFADDHPSRKSGLFPWEVRF